MALNSRAVAHISFGVTGQESHPRSATIHSATRSMQYERNIANKENPRIIVEINMMYKALIIGFIILTIALWFWAILDISRSRFKNPTMRMVWLLAILFLPVLGSIFYFQLRRKFVVKEPRKFQPNSNKAV